MKLDELKDAAWEARRAHNHILGERNNAIRAECDAVRSRIVAQYDDRVNAAHAAKEAAELAQREEEYRLAAEAPQAPYPVGTRMVEWRVDHWTQKAHRTGKLGVLEVRTKESKFPANQVHGVPSIGQAYIRELKKDGTPGLKVEKYLGNWRPEGIAYETNAKEA